MKIFFVLNFIIALSLAMPAAPGLPNVRIQNIGLGMSEKAVLSKLGNPNFKSNSVAKKYFRFNPSKRLEIEVSFYKGRVYYIHSSGPVKLEIENSLFYPGATLPWKSLSVQNSSRYDHGRWADFGIEHRWTLAIERGGDGEAVNCIFRATSESELARPNNK